MNIVVVGINHKTAPVEVRERLAMVSDELPGAIKTLNRHVTDGAILSTCNRSEVYAVAETPEIGYERLTGFLTRYHRVPQAEIESYLYRHADEDAFRHLFEVASGIDSMILGETEILGQVRDALSACTTADMIDSTIPRLFHHALRTGRRARTETRISQHAASVSSAAAQMARSVFGGLDQCRVLVISAGEAGKLAAQCIKDAGAADLAVANRTRSRAEALAQELGARTIDFEDIQTVLPDYDIVISATAAGKLVLPLEAITRATERRNGRPLCLIDIAVPRNVDPDSRKLPNVHLFDIDDLEAVSLANLGLRKKEVPKVRAIIEEEVKRFNGWYRGLEVAPTIASLQQKIETIRRDEVERRMRKLTHLSAKDRNQIIAMTKAITAKLLHEPTMVLKEQGQRKGYVEAVQAIFHLDVE